MLDPTERTAEVLFGLIMVLAFTGSLSVLSDGKRIAIEDAASIPASLRGYVQLALDQGLINARFAVTQGPFDLQPVLRAYFDPAQHVTRPGYAAAASRLLGVYGL